jgi:hypothetical protein
MEGWRLAQDRVYSHLKPGEVPSAEYVVQHVALCKRQALLAGYRLAEYLNRTLGK